MKRWLFVLFLWPALALAHEDLFPRTADFDFEPPPPGSYRLPPIMPAPDGVVLDAEGRRHRLHELIGGRPVLLSFVYTRCEDEKGCPLATGVLLDVCLAGEDAPDLARSVRLITLSFDPEHDTPAVMARYGAIARDRNGPICPWDFLTTPSAAELQPLLDGFNQVVDKSAEDKVQHLLRVYLIDRDRRVRNIYDTDLLDPRLVVADLRTLMME